MQTVRQRKLKLLVFYPTSNPSPRPAGGAHGGRELDEHPCAGSTIDHFSGVTPGN
jgi:hypothetical protein